MPIYLSPQKGIPFVLQAAGAAAADGNVASVPSTYKDHVVYITGSAGVASGAVTVESAPSPDYTGTWKAEAAAVTVLASTTLAVRFTGPVNALRARISTLLAGGTVDCVYLGN